MRSSKSRSRSKSNRQRSLGNIVNRVFESSGPEGKVRGTPQQIIEKYLTLARDAQLSHDRVAEQSFLQHAEHYTRMLGEAQREMAERQPQPNGNGQHGHQGHQGGQNGGQNGGGGQHSGHQGGYAQQGRTQDDEQPREHQPRDQARDQARTEPRQEPRAELRPEPRAEQRSEPAPVEDTPALPDPVGDESETGPVETPEAAEAPEATEAKPRSRRSSRPRSTGGEETAPRIAPARSRRKPAAAAGAPAEAPASPEGSGD
ncbi:DUF4167 domain-containing protein [Paracoccus sp. NSM]|uniref:DUF4167 domain-containing protein n=1 Tax=Paracoccus sp. NSM TaxID=3457784 RepID=UPI0040364876